MPIFKLFSCSVFLLMALSCSLFSETKTFLGPTELERLSVEELIIKGSLEAKEIKCHILEVSGMTKISQFNISQKAIINGSVCAKDGAFSELNGKGLIALDSVTANHVLVRPGNISGLPDMLVLTGSTVVSGDIIFESNQGILLKESTVQIAGKIIGAKTQVTDNPPPGFVDSLLNESITGPSHQNMLLE